jgi:hypothetical protein
LIVWGEVGFLLFRVHCFLFSFGDISRFVPEKLLSASGERETGQKRESAARLSDASDASDGFPYEVSLTPL